MVKAIARLNEFYNMKTETLNTQKPYKMALLGKDIGYSLSGKIFSSAAIQKIFPNQFEIIDLQNVDQWQDFWKNKAINFNFLAITTPWKRKVLELKLDNISPEVATSKTSNWVRLEEGKLSAFNTDYFAFKKWWGQLPQMPEQIIYLGSGASSYTFFSMLKDLFPTNLGRAKLYLVTRDKNNFIPSGCYEHLKINYLNYQQLYQLELNHKSLIINGTFYGQKITFPIELTTIFEQALVWDLNYSMPYNYYSFYHKGGLDFLLNQALLFLAMQNVINETSFEMVKAEVLNFLQNKASNV